MSLNLCLRAFEFYRLRSDKALKISFVLLLALRVASVFLPFLDQDFSPFFAELNQRSVHPAAPLQALTQGNLYFLLAQLLMIFASWLSAGYYAQTYILEETLFYSPSTEEEDRLRGRQLVARLRQSGREFLQRLQGLNAPDTGADGEKSAPFPARKNFPEFIWSDGRLESTPMSPEPGEPYDYDELYPQASRVGGPARLAARQLWRAMPSLTLLALLGFFVFILSSPLAALPFFIFNCYFIFTPFNILLDKKRLATAMRWSAFQSRGFKLVMFMQFVFVFFVLSILENLFAVLFVDYHYSLQLVLSFVYVLRVFILARLWGMFYLAFAWKRPAIRPRARSGL